MFVEIKPGSFHRGAVGKGDQTVTITRPFFIATTEVTEEQFDEHGERRRRTNDRALPAGDISWFMATAWNKAASEARSMRFDLPTETEWEYACHGGVRGPWNVAGVSEDRLAWYNGTARGVARPPAQLRANAYGLYDMHGNMREWCRDWWSFTPPAGTDPTGPATGTERVRRGGGADMPAADCTCGGRDCGPPDWSWPTMGFRPVIRLPEKGEGQEAPGGSK